MPARCRVNDNVVVLSPACRLSGDQTLGSRRERVRGKPIDTWQVAFSMIAFSIEGAWAKAACTGPSGGRR